MMRLTLIGALIMTIVSPASPSTDTATFAGGCFWCMETPFTQLHGVKEVEAGYTGGRTVNPTYEQVCTGTTGHYESVRVTFDPSVIGYKELLAVFWRNIDPTDAGGQFVDRGQQYETAIFYHNEQQRALAEASKQELGKSGKFKRPIATRIIKAPAFYRAEEYHQHFSLKSPGRYEMYRMNSGRDLFIDKTWAHDPAPDPKKQEAAPFVKPPRSELKKKLTPLQFAVTQENGTEPPYDNEYWDNHREGLYVDRVSGEPLFSSRDKFDSECGWPSFTKPVDPANVIERTDRSLLMERTEVRSLNANSHLGHVFPDGPAPTGLRYCINSAAVRFVPREDMAKEGYAEYERLLK